MTERINLTCQTCYKVYDLPKTEEIPAHVFQMKCNWCPGCEDQADDYYEEWWDENDNDGTPPPAPVPDNQLCMPFLFDELEIKQIELLPNIGQGAQVSDTRDDAQRYIADNQINPK